MPAASALECLPRFHLQPLRSLRSCSLHCACPAQCASSGTHVWLAGNGHTIYLSILMAFLLIRGVKHALCPALLLLTLLLLLGCNALLFTLLVSDEWVKLNERFSTHATSILLLNSIGNSLCYILSKWLLVLVLNNELHQLAVQLYVGYI